MSDSAPATAALPGTVACPCGSALRYSGCCGRWHGGPLHLQAPDAPTLMRSRYSAYVLGLSDYLLATWQPGTRPAALPAMEPGLKWLGLEIRRSGVGEPGAVAGSHTGAGAGSDMGADVNRAWVEFVARSKLGGRAHRLQETSRFVHEGGRWYYLDGELK